MIGQKFGKLTIIKDTGKKYHGSKIFLCKCGCGNYIEVNQNKLKTGHTKSCGCLNHKIKDLTGQKFGRLTVLSFNGRKNKSTYWNCECDCGNKVILTTNKLKTGSTKSCGCLNDDVRKITIKQRMQFVDGTSLVAISKNRRINKNNTSGHRGVSYNKSKNKWVAQITFKGKNYYLGRFDTIGEAVKARENAEVKYFDNYINKK